MSGILTIGGVELEVVALHGFQDELDIQFPEHDVLEAQPKLQDTGDGLRTLTISAKLYARFGDPQTLSDRLSQAQRARRVVDVVWRSGRDEGDFIIKRITKNLIKTDPQGHPILIRLELELKEWAGDAGALTPIFTTAPRQNRPLAPSQPPPSPHSDATTVIRSPLPPEVDDIVTPFDEGA